MRLCVYILPLIAPLAALAASGGSASVQERFAAAQARFEVAQVQLAKAAEAAEATPVTQSAGRTGATSGGDASLAVRRTFREAAEEFAALARDGVASANLYVNAGNAFHFAGDEARALLWYLRADRLAHTAEIRSGLAGLRRACKASAWPPPRPSIGRVLMFWHYDLGHRFKQWFLLVVYPAGCVLIMVSLFAQRGSLRRPCLRAGLALMIVGAIAGISDAVSATSRGDQWGVVLEQTRGLSGDGQMYSVVVDSIAPGQEVRIVEARPNWLHVELPSGTRCWLSAGSCEAVASLAREEARL